MTFATIDHGGAPISAPRRTSARHPKPSTAPAPRLTPPPSGAAQSISNMILSQAPLQGTPSATAQAPATMAGAGGGAVGGGGGAGGGAAAPHAMTPPAPPQLDTGEIMSALNAISAMFDLQRGELTGEQEAAKAALGRLMDMFGRAQQEAVTGARGEAAGRGILRSGLFLGEVGRIGERAAQERAGAQAEHAAREAAIQRRIAGLSQQEQAQREQTARQIAREQVGTQEAIAQALRLV